MTTRLSKIARLPATIREQLNRRLHNGELGRTILPWVNELPKTKKVLAEIFNSKPITHQNLSEWRATGYQDWLFHQQRLDWFSRLEEEDKEISKHDRCGDTYEAMSRFFLFEIGQAMRDAQKIKNPDARWERIERLTDKFARLQNSYNWSRRCQLEYDKYNGPEPEEPAEESEESYIETMDQGGASVLASRSQNEPPAEVIEVEQELIPQPKCQPSSRRSDPLPCRESGGAGALQDAPRTSETEGPRASIPDSGSPLPLSDLPTPSSDLPTPNCAPIPTPAPTPQHPTPSPDIPAPKPSQPPTWKTHKVHSIPIRGRRFVCVEG